MKRIISMIMIVALIFSMNLPTLAVSYEPSSWAKEEVESAISNGYVPEHLQRNYQEPITREEFAELFVTAVFTAFNKGISNCDRKKKKAWGTDKLTLDLFLEKVSTTEKFIDTDNKYVKVANILGMVNGIGDNKFNPEGLITREQAAIMFINYFQTVDKNNTNEAPRYLDDLNEASSWAREAVARAYGAGYIKGTIAADEDKYGNIIKKGHFDTKGNFTREQAIIVISRLGYWNLHDLVLRGYVHITMDELMSGFDIEGNTVKMKKSGFDYDYSLVWDNWITQKILRDYVKKYTTEQLAAVVLMPSRTDHDMFNPVNIDKVVSGEKTFYDYKLFTIEHNVDGYLAIVTKREGFGYMSGGGGTLNYGDNNQYIVTLQ